METLEETQQELSLKDPASQRVVPQEDIDHVLFWLEQIDEWTRRDDLLRWLNWPVTDSSRRRLRAVAKASAGRIASAPGSPGYILTRKLRPEDLHYLEALKTQADEMRGHYLEIMRVWHHGSNSNKEEFKTHKEIL